MMTSNISLLPGLAATTAQLAAEFALIPAERKPILQELADFVRARQQAHEKVLLNFICTHNSRRSHVAQIWAQTAAYYYGVPDVFCFSGGTEVSAFSPRAVRAMQNAGFDIRLHEPGDNPVYTVRFSLRTPALDSFSKTYDDAVNPKADFAAIMTCAHADENCPLVRGAAVRIALNYDDPKAFDGTPEEVTGYQTRVHQIGREMLYAFSLLA